MWRIGLCWVGYSSPFTLETLGVDKGKVTCCLGLEIRRKTPPSPSDQAREAERTTALDHEGGNESESGVQEQHQ
ncbi:hypothetical protein DY000_02052869 [Brassica cretica]|uniref:Uncharacterized protein n=1 Tax=Brassica cretica TaxID=69181 RepID=A0ABQ7AMG8_BRACR|nr:hypothetical protein DY000_02052869 [Brassica cretica]